MSGILLDTNALFFAVAEPNRLGKHTRNRILKSTFVYYSAINLAEFTIKGRERFSRLTSLEPKVFQDAGFKKLAFDADAARAMDRFTGLRHSDPFDWMLLSQAASEECDFYTKDMRLLELGLDFVKDASD